jgi:hypothetical protein
MVSIILMFSGKTIITIINGISAVFPFLHDKLHAALKSQKEKLHLKKVSEDKHWIAQVWDYVILIMVAYFVLSIINSSVQNHLVS